ncbi:MAG: hypothetical protein JXA18_08990 [Chitinispirillaceae bacterium]|nr:hypothetical protein [Chitinispirillaceae bacterium]
MTKGMPKKRICFIDPDRNGITLVLHATNSLQVNVMADLFPPREEGDAAVEAMTLDTGYHSEGTLNRFPQQLNNHTLFIRFNARSVHPDLDRGKISLDIFQDDRRCMITKPAVWMRIVPKYGTGRGFEWATAIQFCCSA